MGLKDDLHALRALRLQVGRQLAAEADFAEQVKRLRLGRHMRLEDLAERTGISKAYLSQVENGRVDPPKDDKVRRLEEAFTVQPGSLLALAHMARAPQDVRDRLAQLRSAFARAEETVRALAERLPGAAGELVVSAAPGSGGRQRAATPGNGGRSVTEAIGNVTAPATATVRRPVPIVNCAAAGYPQEFTDLGRSAGAADDYIAAPPGLDDPHAFAVRVVGDSMAPKYTEGDIVLFGPAAAVQSGDDCYVRLTAESPATEAATFRRVYFDSETSVRLQPLNDRYPPTVVPLAEIAALYRAVWRYESL